MKEKNGSKPVRIRMTEYLVNVTYAFYSSKPYSKAKHQELRKVVMEEEAKRLFKPVLRRVKGKEGKA